MPLVALLLVALAADPSVGPVHNADVHSAETTAGFDTLVVCPDSFQTALQPWFDLRRGEGHTIATLSNLATPDEIRGTIRRLNADGRLRFVLLVGGAEHTMNENAALRARSVPMHYAKARVNVKWGSTPTIATDDWYVEPPSADDDHPMPSLAIGRIPAESPEDLAAIVKKIVAYERSSDFGPWRRQMNFVAGVGNFGLLADTVIESTATLFLTQSIPPEYRVSMTYGNWRSPYCPDPRRFHETAIERLDEGALFWVYIGHGSVHETAPLQVSFKLPGRQRPILQSSDVALLRGDTHRPIALFLACYAGAVDARGGCLASSLLRAPHGPVAVVAGSRVTMPYALTLMATNLTDDLFRSPCATLGEALLHAKQRMLRPAEKNDSRRAMLDTVAAAVSPSAADMTAERAEHVLMFNLIGDPLLRLRHPRPVALKTPRKAKAGERLIVEGTTPIAGRATIELNVRRDRIVGERPARNDYPAGDADLAAFDAVYRRANNRCLNSVSLAVGPGPFRAELDVPLEAAGPCNVNVFIAGDGDMAASSADIEVAK